MQDYDTLLMVASNYPYAVAAAVAHPDRPGRWSARIGDDAFQLLGLHGVTVQ